MDWVRDPEVQAKRDEYLRVRGIILNRIMGISVGKTRKEVLAIRMEMIEQLKEMGRTDAESMFNSCWPSLKPQEGEE